MHKYFCIVLILCVSSCSHETGEQQIVLFDKTYIMNQSLDNFKNKYNNLERYDNGGMTGYIFFTQVDTMECNVKCRLFYGFWKSKLVYLQIDSDSIAAGDIMPNVRSNNLKVLSTTDSSKGYQFFDDKYYKFLQVMTYPTIKKLHFLCIKKEHLDNFKISIK